MRYGVPERPEDEPPVRTAAERGALPPAILGLDGAEPPAPEPRKPRSEPTQRSRRSTPFFFAAGGEG